MPLARHLMAGMVALRADLNVCFIGSFSLKASGKMESKRTESICSQWVNESHFFRPPRQDFSLIGMAQELLLHIRTTFCLRQLLMSAKFRTFISIYSISFYMRHLTFWSTWHLSHISSQKW